MNSIPFDDRDGFIWVNGAMVAWRAAQTHILSHGLHYASSIFEGERAYDGVIFESRLHTERFRKSAQIMGFDLPFSDDALLAAKEQLLEKNGLKDAYLRPVAWRGSEQMAVAAQHTKIHVSIACWEWPSMFDLDAKMRGISLDIAEWRRPSPESAPVHAKAAGLYMICTLAKHAAEAKGFADAMMLDYRGYVAEATGANIFFVMEDGAIHTPIADCFLNGITRQSVMKMLGDMGYQVVERHILPEELAQVKECFLTGTAAEVTPVSQIGDHHMNPGAACRAITENYAKLVRGGI